MKTNTIFFDEFDLLSYCKRQDIPLKGAFAISGKCNLKCNHCYTQGNWGKSFCDKLLIIDIAKQAFQQGNIFLTLTGGEPLFHPDFEIIYKTLWQLGLKLSIRTNATLITKNIATLFSEYPPFEIVIGMYGLDQKTYTAVTNNPAAYDLFIDGLNNLKEKKMAFSIRALITKQNFCDAERYKKFSDKYNTKIVFTTTIVDSIDENKSLSHFELSIEEKKKYVSINSVNLVTSG